MKQTLQVLFDPADIQINGSRPWDIQVHNPDFYARLLAGGSLTLGESYMDGWWDCAALDQFFYRILKYRIDQKARLTPNLVWQGIKATLFNQQSRAKSQVVGQKHYDVGNELYQLMLDKRMNYSCGYWKNAANLDEAQEAKLDLICQKLQLKSGQTLLDIGCGWGGLVQFAVEKYGVKAVGITISQEQAKLARQRCAGLDIEIREQDYREINAKFDRIVSVGMIEHVGYKNYRQFMQIASQNLHDDGLFLLHTIGGNTSEKHTEPWLEKYIFPNSMIPSARQLTQAAEGIFMLKDWHNFGPDYDPTLMAWHKNFNDHWDQIKHKYDERFFRMWNYYLSAAAGSFRAQRNQLWQIVYSQIDAEVPYQSVR